MVIEIFLVSFILFAVVSCGLALTQWLCKAPMPVGCTPVNGQCCRQLSRDGVCAGDAANVEVRNAGA